MANRDKSAKFIELANKRVNKAIKEMQLIANLSNKQNYEFSDEQAKRIVKALQQEIDVIKQSFQTAYESGRRDFKL